MEKNYSDRNYYFAILGLTVITIVVFTLTFVFSARTNTWFIKEGGLVESLSAIGYFIAVAVIFLKGGYAYFLRYWYFAVLFTAFGLRELDFDKRFTEVGILKSRFLMSPDVSFSTKIISYAIVFFILYAIFKIVKNHAKLFLDKVFKFRFDPVTLSISVAVAFLAISKTLDGLARKLADYGIEISEKIGSAASMLEESMELSVPYLFALAVLAFLERQR